MRAFLSIVCCCLMVAACGGGRESPSSFPLEVLGAAGSEVALEMDVDAATLNSAQSAAVTLTLHNVVQADSAALVINGGAPVDLSEFARPDGRVTTATLPIDRARLKAGDNRFVFRYTRQVMDTGSAVSGYRVLNVKLQVGDKTLQPDAPREDPTLWQPIRADAKSLERGRFFFTETSRDDGPACTRCHADSGADLQYYAFSNHSIVERAMFHRFSREEAEDIASYIRSLEVVRAGRPYQSPFQPGADNAGAAGASIEAVLADDASFAKAGGEPVVRYDPWESAASVDTFRLPAAVHAPTWLRWLPRKFDPSWFTRADGVLANTEAGLAKDPSIENARAFMSAAIRVGTDILVTTGDHEARIDVLRFAAVKLWDWSRRMGFDRPDHGFPDGGPAYPYEVGVAFFEAAAAGKVVPEASKQTMSWWWAQLAANPGRGLSSGQRPLNYRDVLTAASGAALGPQQLRFLYLYGSWEESRGELATSWGTERGPVRLLDTPLSTLTSADRVAVLVRFLRRETEFLNGGGPLTQTHHRMLTQAWNRTCEQLTVEERATVRSAVPTEVSTDFAGCP